VSNLTIVCGRSWWGMVYAIVELLSAWLEENGLCTRKNRKQLKQRCCKSKSRSDFINHDYSSSVNEESTDVGVSWYIKTKNTVKPSVKWSVKPSIHETV